MMRFIGIDPGQSGGIALISPTGVKAAPMPLHPKSERKLWGSPIDWMSFFQTLRSWGTPGASVAIEHVHAMPKQGVSSMFTFGGNYTGLLTVLQILELDYEIVSPRRWKEEVLGDTYSHDKGGAIAFCDYSYPECSLLATSRSRVPHDGMADALCLARYAELNHAARE